MGDNEDRTEWGKRADVARGGEKKSEKKKLLQDQTSGSLKSVAGTVSTSRKPCSSASSKEGGLSRTRGKGESGKHPSRSPSTPLEPGTCKTKEKWTGEKKVANAALPRTGRERVSRGEREDHVATDCRRQKKARTVRKKSQFRTQMHSKNWRRHVQSTEKEKTKISRKGDWKSWNSRKENRVRRIPPVSRRELSITCSSVGGNPGSKDESRAARNSRLKRYGEKKMIMGGGGTESSLY